MGITGKLSDREMAKTQVKLKKFKIIMDSMTDSEMGKPHIIKSSRIMRIARGSGTDPKDVKALLKHYQMAKKAVRGFSGSRKMRKRLMRQLKLGDIEL